MSLEVNKENDLLVMKLLHYFIVEENYSPIIIKGIKNEIWLENMDAEYKVARIVLGHIHNKEQYDFDKYRTSKLIKQIKSKTFNFRIKVLSLYMDVEQRVELLNEKNHFPLKVESENSIKKNDEIIRVYPNVKDKLLFNEKGAHLFKKINEDIAKKNEEQNKKINKTFKNNQPIVTNAIIGINILLFMAMYLLGEGSTHIPTLVNFGGLIKDGNIFRLITSGFLHIGLLHLFFNCYALKIIGPQVESVYGHGKFAVIYLISIIIGNLFSLVFVPANIVSAGASGAIFGLLGSLLYFGYHHRTYLSSSVASRVFPVILINLLFGMAMPSINNFAHIGGLIGGILASISVGVIYKTSKFEKINGAIATAILIIMLYIIGFN